MIRSIYIEPKSKKVYNLSVDDMKSALENPDGLLWISLENPTPEEVEQILRGVFQFHPLAVEDSLNIGYQTPKVDDYGKYIFIVFHALRSRSPDADTLETLEINLFLGMNFLVTLFLDTQLEHVNRLWKRLERDERLLQFGSDFLCHGLLDMIVDDYIPMLDQLDDEIEWLEEQVLAKPTPHILARILSLKHTIMTLRRVISPQREVVNRLSRDEFPMIDSQSQIYFRDIYDHLVRFQDLSESLRDIVSGAMDIYLNSTSLRLNEVMKALTIVSTIFLPLSFLAGVYGMNFTRQVPDYNSPMGIEFFWFITIMVAGGMLYFFRRRGWF